MYRLLEKGMVIIEALRALDARRRAARYMMYLDLHSCVVRYCAGTLLILLHDGIATHVQMILDPASTVEFEACLLCTRQL